CHASRSSISAQPFGPRTQRCSRMTTLPPHRIGTCVRAVLPSAPRNTTVPDTMLGSARPDAASQWLSALRTSSCDVAQFGESVKNERVDDPAGDDGCGGTTETGGGGGVGVRFTTRRGTDF